MSLKQIALVSAAAVLISAVICCPVIAQAQRLSPSAFAAQECVKLNAAVEKGSADEVAALLDDGVDADCRNSGYDETPLMQAATDGSLEVVKVLVRHGANLAPTGTYRGRFPLTLAAGNKSARNSNLDMVKFLVESGADVNANCTEKGSSAYLAVEQIGPRNLTPLGAATITGNLPVAEYLLLHKAKVNGRDGSSYTALMWACVEGNPEIVKILLRHGADPKLTTDRGQNARSFAAGRNHKDVLALLDAMDKIQQIKPATKQP